MLDSLEALSRNAYCYFIDYKLVSKHTVYELTRGFTESTVLGKDLFIVHTCLRLEIYSFDTDIRIHAEGFAKLQGKLVVRRLLSLMTGAQSEIVGETEVLGQVKQSIAKSISRGTLAKSTFWNLMSLMNIAEDLRLRHGVNCIENYSSVGAEVFNNLIFRHDETISVIGSGYMAEVFFKNLSKATTSKIYWINRNVDKAKKLRKTIGVVDNYDITHVSIDDCRDILEKSDFVFAAYKEADGLFAEYDLSRAKAVVDVSYPSLFAENCNPNFLSINNTFFEKYIGNPVDKASLLKCEMEIDSLLSL